jgi:asparagine synthetase B (glutamine-hydrolysing)
MIDFLIQYDLGKREWKFLSEPSSLIEINTGDITLKLWGDPINYKELQLSSSTNAKDIIETIIGHFYYVLSDTKRKTFVMGNSIFGILPLYYSNSDQIAWFSNDPLAIADKIQKPTISKRFILENILFNYPLFNNSCFNTIHLLNVNSCLSYEEKELKVLELLRIENYFVKDPLPVNKSADHISNLFLEQAVKYFPNENYSVSLTGGFDGRTLTAASLYHKKKFDVYSFGSDESNDVSIPGTLAKTAKIKYTHIKLDQSYVSKSLEYGTDFIVNSNGTASFSRAHYLYAASMLKNETNYLVTGNFGSELFRAPHSTGVLISRNLLELFKATNFEEAIKRIENNPEWQALNKKEFEGEWKSLCEDLKKLPCFNREYSHLTKNQQFALVLFNEVIRKYFGAELINQYKLVKNRTPFLDLTFMKELFKTELSGVYSEFFTNDPLKRFKGQVTYAHIIKKAFAPFGKIITDKGYKPDMILNMIGKVGIAFAFFKKKLTKKDQKLSDHYKVDEAFEKNRNLIRSEIKEHSYFNTGFINNGLDKKYNSRDSFFVALSQLWWLNYLEKKYAIKN